MLVLEFTDVLAFHLLNNSYSDLDIKDNDPYRLPSIVSENKSALEDYDLNGFDKYYHFHNENLPHQLINSPERMSKSGKKYHKTNNCIVCKHKNVCC